MNAEERAQVGLILETAADLSATEFAEVLEATYADFSAKGMLRSGNTVYAVIKRMEEAAERLISNSVDQVSKVDSTIESFELVSESLLNFVKYMEKMIDSVVDISCSGTRRQSVHSAATELFAKMTERVRRQLELHRFSFSKTPSPTVADATPALRRKGGRLPAEFWDDMWAAIAAQLYDGTLEPTKQVHIEAAMADWIIGNGHEAGTTAIRGRARRLWDAINADVG